MTQQLIEQYVAGKMGEVEADAFEESCLRDPELARQVELEQRLKLGIEQVSRNSEEFVRSGGTGIWQLAVAASILVVLTAGVWMLQRAPQANEHALAAVVPELQHGGTSMRLALERGAEIPELPRGVVRVAIAGLFETGAQYSISLDRLHALKPAQTIAMLEAETPTSPVTLEVMIDSDLLESGTYSLRVRRQASDEEALDFGFIKP